MHTAEGIHYSMCSHCASHHAPSCRKYDIASVQMEESIVTAECGRTTNTVQYHIKSCGSCNFWDSTRFLGFKAHPRFLARCCLIQVNSKYIAEDLIEDYDAGLEYAEADCILDVQQKGDSLQYLIR